MRSPNECEALMKLGNNVFNHALEIINKSELVLNVDNVLKIANWFLDLMEVHEK